MKSITPVSPALTGALTFDYGVDPKIYFRNSSQWRLSENFTPRKFPAIRYVIQFHTHHAVDKKYLILKHL